MEIRDYVGLSFDDVLLVPRYSDISSRFSDEIDMSVDFLPGVKIKYPIISANMDRVSNGALVAKLVEYGGIGIVHRFLEFDEHVAELNVVPEGYRIGCVGVGTEGVARLDYLVSADININGVLIDVAHGHSASVIKQVKHIRATYPWLGVIAGNVATYEGATDLLEAGAHVIKIGVGNGSVCSTRVQTGNGVPQITAISWCKSAVEDFTFDKGDITWWPKLISDGGVRESEDFVKALACGADLVMSGSIFAGADETPGNIIKTKGGKFKSYRGSASKEAQENWKGKATSVEGETTLVPYKGPVEEVLEVFFAGVRSGFSYQGARTISELQENAEFIRQTSAGYIEGTPHGVRR